MAIILPMANEVTKTKRMISVPRILTAVSAVLILATIGFSFLPLLSLNTGFGETIGIESTTLMLGGKIDVVLPSGSYHLSFAANIFFFIMLQLVLLSGLALITSINSGRNSVISLIFLFVSIVFFALIPVWISIVNQAYEVGEFKVRVGYFAVLFASILSFLLKVAAIILKKKNDTIG